MKRGLFFLFTCLVAFEINGQQFSAGDLLFASCFTAKKFDNYIAKKKFLPSGSRIDNGQMVHVYNLKPPKRRKKDKDTLIEVRKIETCQAKDDFSYTFFTSSRSDYTESLQDLREEGFFCGNENDTGTAMLFQKRLITIHVNRIIDPELDTLYSFCFQEAKLPLPEEVEFAEDLLKFKSHQYLVSMFGEKNVIKDVYYFSEKEVSRCSVVFPKTARQAVFIWEDEANLINPQYVIVGGNMRFGSVSDYDGVIIENAWSSKEGIYSGMSLASLLKLNGNSFNFYGRDSKIPYMIVPERTGNIDFKKSKILLGCLNPTGSKLLSKPTVNAEDIEYDNLGLYVFMIMIANPSSSNSPFNKKAFF